MAKLMQKTSGPLPSLHLASSHALGLKFKIASLKKKKKKIASLHKVFPDDLTTGAYIVHWNAIHVHPKIKWLENDGPTILFIDICISSRRCQSTCVLSSPIFQLFSPLIASYKPPATLPAGFSWLQGHDPVCRLQVSVNQCPQKQSSTVIQWKMSDTDLKPHHSGGATLGCVMQSLSRVPRGLSPSSHVRNSAHFHSL